VIAKPSCPASSALSLQHLYAHKTNFEWLALKDETFCSLGPSKCQRTRKLNPIQMGEEGYKKKTNISNKGKGNRLS